MNPNDWFVDRPVLEVHSPTPLVAHAEVEALVAGPERLQALLERFLRRLPAERLADIAVWIADEAPKPLRLGTMCSGIDGPILCWQALNAALDAVLSTRLVVEHTFSCEHCEGKKKFLRDMWSPSMRALFARCRELVGEMAVGVVDPGHSFSRRVPAVGHLVAGFPCQDAGAGSAATDSPASRRCMVGGTLRTGSALHDVVRYVQNHVVSSAVVLSYQQMLANLADRELHTVVTPALVNSLQGKVLSRLSGTLISSYSVDYMGSGDAASSPESRGMKILSDLQAAKGVLMELKPLVDALHADPAPPAAEMSALYQKAIACSSEIKITEVISSRIVSAAIGQAFANSEDEHALDLMDVSKSQSLGVSTLPQGMADDVQTNVVLKIMVDNMRAKRDCAEGEAAISKIGGVLDVVVKRSSLPCNSTTELVL